MTTLIEGLLWTTFFAVLSLTIFVVVRRHLSTLTRERHNGVVGSVSSILGGLGTFLLAFVVVVVWQNFHEAGSIAQREVNALVGIYDLTRGLPDPTRSTLQDLTRQYATAVIEQEWPLMAVGRQSQQVTDMTHRMRDAIDGFQPQSVGDQVVDDHLRTEYQALRSERNLRLLASTSSLPPMLWVILIGASVLVVAVAYLFAVADTRLHAILIGVVSVTIAAVVFMISVMDQPYTGDARVNPTAFQSALQILQGG